MMESFRVFIAALVLAASAGCATRPTVDDGRRLDPQLVAQMHAYGEAAAALRPAIVRAAALGDSDCSTQYELPFDVMTSYGLDDENAKIAWLRTLDVDDSLTVIASVPYSGVVAGDVVAQVGSDSGRDPLEMAEALAEARDRGEPFILTLASGERLTISPIKLCRGHVLVAPPFEPAQQRYHWSGSVHPLEIFHQPLSADEAEWIVLWTQGLSERGGARMKAYAFMMGGIKWMAVLALGATTSSATASVRSAAAAGSSSAGPVAAVQLAGQAASLMARSAANRAALSGISGVAAGVFEKADQWAFEHMRKLGMNPRAGLSLHEKLVARGAAANAFLLDEKRLAAMRALVAGLPRSQPPGRRH